MENLVPPLLSALREAQWSISAGKSMKESMQNYLERHQDPLAEQLRPLWILRQKGGRADPTTLNTHFQRAFWDLVERGCEGQPTLEALIALESEVDAAAALELEEHLATLPFKVLLPLLLFQFPAYLILLLGPLLRELQHQIGG